MASSLTVSDSLDWLFLYLCEHQDLQERCYKELSDVLQGRPPTMEDQTRLPFLDACLKELFRIHPAAPLSTFHQADQDFTLAGYNIEKGSVVIQNCTEIGNSEKFFENASQFDPERWLREPELNSNLLTFGYGPPMCLGMHIAKQEFFIAAASMLQKYKFTFGQSTTPDFAGEYKLTFNPKPWKAFIALRKEEGNPAM